MSGSGISWAICKSAPQSRQITTPAPHHSVFYRPDALPVAQPTASKHWRHHYDIRLPVFTWAPGADVSQATHEQTSYVYDTSLIYRKKPYNKNSKTRSRRQAGRRMLPPGRSTHARTGGRTNRKHNADAAHKLAGGGTVKEIIKISR